MENWKKYTVDQLVKRGVIEKPLDGNHGGTHPKGSDFVTSGIPFIMASDINSGQINLTSCSFITKKQADRLRKGFAKEGDVLLTHKASIGRTAVVPEIDYDYIMLTPQVTYYRIKDNKELNNKFLKYFFNSPTFQNEINTRAGSGSTRAYIGITDQRMLTIQYPPLQEQQAIACILSALDDKIELNLQMNKTLEEMAMALYKHWFVDYGPFQNGKFVESELGMIPEGWEVKRLEDFVSLTMGQSPKSEFYNDDKKGLPFHQGVSNYGIRFPIDKTYSLSGSREALEGDILFSVRAPVGRLNIAKNRIILGRGLASMRMKGSNNFLYYALKTMFSSEDIIGSGTVFNSVNKLDLQNLKFIIPSKTVLNEFQIQVETLDHMYFINSMNNQTLTTLRDTLLPKLISGEVRVKDIEQMVAAAL